MGLADLKKKKKEEEPSPSPPVTIDEFINDAELYALGHPRVVSPDRRIEPPPPAPGADTVPPSGRAVFKKATYSMTLESVEHLTKIAEEDGFNRSQLIRLFTHYFYQLPEEERALIYARFHELLEHRK